MRKKASKLLSVLLIIALVFSVAPAAYAAEEAPVTGIIDAVVTDNGDSTVTLTADDEETPLEGEPETAGETETTGEPETAAEPENTSGDGETVTESEINDGFEINPEVTSGSALDAGSGEEPPAEAKVITSFVILEEDPANEVKVVPGTPEDEIPFPETIAALLETDGEAEASGPDLPTEISVPVGEWENTVGPYDADAGGVYMFAPVRDSLALPDGVVLPDAVALPRLRVVVGEVVITPQPYAEDYTLYYNTSDGKLHKEGINGTVAENGDGSFTGNYSGSGNTLTLNGFNFTSSNNPALSLSNDLIINITGENSIISTHSTSGGSIIYTEKDLTIDGEGTLDLTFDSTTTGCSGIAMWGGDLAINGGTVIVSGTSMMFIAISIFDSLTVSGAGTLIAIAGEYGMGVLAASAPATAMGSVNASGEPLVELKWSADDRCYVTDDTDENEAMYVKLEGGGGDTTKPKVLTATPGGTGAAVSGNVVITFNEAMDTTVPGSVKLGTTELTGGTWNDGKTVYTAPYSGLDNDTAYTIDISGFKDTAGNAMTQNSSNSFTTIAAKSLSFIAVTTPPAKITYTAGQSFNSAGMVVTATYSDSTTTAVTGYTISPSGALATSHTSVTISYTENNVTKTTTQPITVNSAGGNNNNNGGGSSRGSSGGGSSSGSTSGGGSSSPAPTTPPTIPGNGGTQTMDGTKINVPISVGTGQTAGDVTVKLDSRTTQNLINNALAAAEKQLADAIREAESKGQTPPANDSVMPVVTFDLSAVPNADSARLDVNAAKSFSEAAVAVTIKLPSVEITLQPEALTSLVEVTDIGTTPITVEAATVPIRELKGIQAAQVKDYETVINVDVFVGGNKVDVPVTISMPYKLKANEDPNAVCVWHLGDDGSLTKLNGIYDSKTGMITFTVTHQSYFVVGYDPVAFWINKTLTQMLGATMRLHMLTIMN